MKLHEINDICKQILFELYQMDGFVWKRQRIYSLYHSILSQVLES